MGDERSFFGDRVVMVEKSYRGKRQQVALGGNMVCRGAVLGGVRKGRVVYGEEGEFFCKRGGL